jgi:hypothetical protein
LSFFHSLLQSFNFVFFPLILSPYLDKIVYARLLRCNTSKSYFISLHNNIVMLLRDVMLTRCARRALLALPVSSTIFF